MRIFLHLLKLLWQNRIEKSEYYERRISSFEEFCAIQTIAQQGVFWENNCLKKPWFDDNLFYVITASDELSNVANTISASGAHIDSQKLIYVPRTTASIDDPSIARHVLRLWSALDDYDDTQSVYGNFDIPEQLMETIEI